MLYFSLTLSGSALFGISAHPLFFGQSFLAFVSLRQLTNNGGGGSGNFRFACVYLGPTKTILNGVGIVGAGVVDV